MVRGSQAESGYKHELCVFIVETSLTSLSVLENKGCSRQISSKRRLWSSVHMYVCCAYVCVWCVCVCLCVCSLRLETLRTLNTSEQQQGFNVPQGETPFSTCTKLLLHSFYSWWIFLMWNKYCHHSIQTSARTHARTHTHRLGILVSWMLTRHLSQSRSNWVDSFNVVAQMRALSSALLTTSLVQVTLKHANHFKGTSLHTIQS